jgi:hypothetical protein
MIVYPKSEYTDTHVWEACWSPFVVDPVPGAIEGTRSIDASVLTLISVHGEKERGREGGEKEREREREREEICCGR